MKIIDLFCGAGGFSKGFEMAGFNIVLGIDNWDLAIKNFKLNHPSSEILLKDICNVNPDELPNAEIIIGGPPCQEFTSLNLKRQPWRGMLNICHFLRIIDKFDPKYWLMENVIGLEKYLPNYLNRFKLRASSYGCKTGRLRLFVGNVPKPFPTIKNPRPLRTVIAVDNRNLEKELPEFHDLEELQFMGSEKEIIQMKANAVPPKLGYAIACGLLNDINKKRRLEHFS